MSSPRYGDAGGAESCGSPIYPVPLARSLARSFARARAFLALCNQVKVAQAPSSSSARANRRRRFANSRTTSTYIFLLLLLLALRHHRPSVRSEIYDTAPRPATRPIFLKITSHANSRLYPCRDILLLPCVLYKCRFDINAAFRYKKKMQLPDVIWRYTFDFLSITVSGWTEHVLPWALSVAVLIKYQIMQYCMFSIKDNWKLYCHI